VLRIEHVIDDGITGAVEWISCPTPPEDCAGEKYRPCQWDVHSWQSGFAAYERNPKNGKIWCVRICDYYDYEYPDNRIQEAYMGNPYPKALYVQRGTEDRKSAYTVVNGFRTRKGLVSRHD
jgi:hypothetical protein